MDELLHHFIKLRKVVRRNSVIPHMGTKLKRFEQLLEGHSSGADQVRELVNVVRVKRRKFPQLGYQVIVGLGKSSSAFKVRRGFHTVHEHIAVDELPRRLDAGEGLLAVLDSRNAEAVDHSVFVKLADEVFKISGHLRPAEPFTNPLSSGLLRLVDDALEVIRRDDVAVSILRHHVREGFVRAAHPSLVLVELSLSNLSGPKLLFDARPEDFPERKQPIPRFLAVVLRSEQVEKRNAVIDRQDVIEAPVADFVEDRLGIFDVDLVLREEVLAKRIQVRVDLDRTAQLASHRLERSSHRVLRLRRNAEPGSNRTSEAFSRGHHLVKLRSKGLLSQPGFANAGPRHHLPRNVLVRDSAFDHVLNALRNTKVQAEFLNQGLRSFVRRPAKLRSERRAKQFNRPHVFEQLRQLRLIHARSDFEPQAFERVLHVVDVEEVSAGTGAKGLKALLLDNSRRVRVQAVNVFSPDAERSSDARSVEHFRRSGNTRS